MTQPKILESLVAKETQVEMVFRHLQGQSRTALEIEALTNISRGSIGRCLTELRHAGVVRKTGASRHNAVVYELVPGATMERFQEWSVRYHKDKRLKQKTSEEVQVQASGSLMDAVAFLELCNSTAPKLRVSATRAQALKDLEQAILRFFPASQKVESGKNAHGTASSLVGQTWRSKDPRRPKPFKITAVKGNFLKTSHRQTINIKRLAKYELIST